MPTGYTHPVQQGEITELPDFAMQCARAFGALVFMRDEPSSASIPDRLPTDGEGHHRERIEAAEKRLELLDTPSKDLLLAELDEHHADLVRQWARRQTERRTHRERYRAMLAKVQAWNPPTPDHVPLKSFMLNQLTKSIDFDCRPSDTLDQEPEKPPLEEWIEAERRRATQSLKYHTEELERARSRNASRQAWIDDLRASLAEPTP